MVRTTHTRPTPDGGPIGVVLAGGAGSRLGSPKAMALLCGRPLIEYPLAALGQVMTELSVVAKADSALPALPGVARWPEPEHPRHPLVGIVAALQHARGRSVIVCAVDLPFVEAATIAALRDAPPALAVLAVDGEGQVQPLLGRYAAAAAPRLALAAQRGTASMRRVVADLSPATVLVDAPDALFNVNTPQDLVRAELLISRR